MNPDELRALADALRPMAKAPCFDGIDIESAADYLRAQADAQPVPAAWRDPDTGELSRIGRVRWRPLYAHPAPAVPAGWKLVPVEPTQAMNNAGLSAVNQYGKRSVWETYAAMLAAAPAAPQAEPIADSDADYWLRNRRPILDAIERAGFALMSNASGFWLHPRGTTAPQAEPSLGELMREQRRSRIVAGAYPDGNPNAGAMMAQTPQAEPCIGNDPTCPCQDGDACHYRDAADGTKGWPVPQAEPIDPHMIVAEDRFPDVPAERWKPCPQCDGDFDRECPICDGLGKVLATDGDGQGGYRRSEGTAMSTPSEILAKWQEADQRLVDEYNDLGYRGIETAVDMTNRRLLCMAGALSVLLKHLSENESKEQR